MKTNVILKFSALNRINVGDIAISHCIEEMFKRKGVEIQSVDLLLRKDADINNSKKGCFSLFRKKALDFIKRFPSLYHIVHIANFNITAWKRMQSLINKYNDSPIIIGGGNLLFNKGGVSFLYVVSKIINKYHSSRKIFLVSIGVGPFSLRWKGELGQIVKNAEYVSVRDQRSLDIIRSVDRTVPVQIIPDPVFLFADLFSNRINKKEKSREEMFCGINIMELNGKGQSIYKIVENLNMISEKTGKKIRIINTSFFSDHIYSGKVSNLLKDTHGVKTDLKNITSEEEVIEAYENMDFLVCSRMHSAIFAASLKIPFFIYPWAPKVTNFAKIIFGDTLAEKMLLKDINYSSDEILNRLSDFSVNEFEEKINLIKKKTAESFEQLIIKIR